MKNSRRSLAFAGSIILLGAASLLAHVSTVVPAKRLSDTAGAIHRCPL